MTQISSSPRRGSRAFAATLALAAVAALTLAPRALVAPARGEFFRLADALPAALLRAVPSGYDEQILNTALFMPLGAAIAMLMSRRIWPIAIALCAAVSATIEIVQEAIPGRVPDLDDVLWNSVGGAVGVVLVTLVRFAAASVRRGRRGRGTEGPR